MVGVRLEDVGGKLVIDKLRHHRVEVSESSEDDFYEEDFDREVREWAERRKRLRRRCRVSRRGG